MLILLNCCQGDEGFAGKVGVEGPKGFTVRYIYISLCICHKWAFLLIALYFLRVQQVSGVQSVYKEQRDPKEIWGSGEERDPSACQVQRSVSQLTHHSDRSAQSWKLHRQYPQGEKGSTGSNGMQGPPGPAVSSQILNSWYILYNFSDAVGQKGCQGQPRGTWRKRRDWRHRTTWQNWISRSTWNKGRLLLITRLENVHVHILWLE